MMRIRFNFLFFNFFLLEFFRFHYYLRVIENLYISVQWLLYIFNMIHICICSEMRYINKTREAQRTQVVMFLEHWNNGIVVYELSLTSGVMFWRMINFNHQLTTRDWFGLQYVVCIFRCWERWQFQATKRNARIQGLDWLKQRCHSRIFLFLFCRRFFPFLLKLNFSLLLFIYYMKW